MKRETGKPLTLAMTPEGERVRMLRSAPPVPDFTPPPTAVIPRPPADGPPREPLAAEAEGPRQPGDAPSVPAPPASSTHEAGPWLARNAYPLAAAAALMWAGTLVAFVAGYENKGGAFDFRPFRWAVAAGLAILPALLMGLFAYALRQAARLASEARATRELAGELAAPAAAAAGRTGAAMEAMREEIARAAEAADEAGRRLAALRSALVEDSDAVAEAAASAERSARTLSGRLQAERAELGALSAAIGDQTTAITEGLAEQTRRVAEGAGAARTQMAEAELGLATRTAELMNAAAEAGRAADGVGGELSAQNERLAALAADLREEREDLARTADALMVEEEALATRLESRRARLIDAVDATRAEAAGVVAAAADGAEGLRGFVAQAGERLREMTEAAVREEDALDARARERTSHYLALVAEERAALEGDARQALARLAEASQSARAGAGAAAAESAAALERSAQAVEESVRRRVDDLAEAAFAANQHADQAFDTRLAAARRTLDAAAGLVEEAGVRVVGRIEAGLEGAHAALAEIGRLVSELEGRLDQAPQVATSRAAALREAVERGSAELAAAARLAAEETQAIDAAFQARAKANYAALGEAARRMGAMAMPAPAASASAARVMAPPEPVREPARAIAPPLVPPQAPPRPSEPAEAAPALTLRPRLKLTPTQEDAALSALFETSAPAPAVGGPTPGPTPGPTLGPTPGPGPADTAAPARREEGWSWKDLLSTLDDGAPVDDEALTDRLIGEIEALGVDAGALLPVSRTDEIARALARGEDQAARESVRRLAPAALRRLSRRVQTDRVLREQAERHRRLFGDRLARAAREDAGAAATLLDSDPGRAWLLLDAAGA